MSEQEAPKAVNFKSSKILAIDPGTDHSAYVLWDRETDSVLESDDIPNEELLALLRKQDWTDHVCIEMIACYGMPVGRETFETVLVIGRAQEIGESRGQHVRLVYRKDVCMWHCGSARAKDPNIRQALIDKYGPTGTKKNPGKLYGISSHKWSALAIAVFVDKKLKLNEGRYELQTDL